jgi:hypothetical protein
MLMLSWFGNVMDIGSCFGAPVVAPRYAGVVAGSMGRRERRLPTTFWFYENIQREAVAWWQPRSLG